MAIILLSGTAIASEKQAKEEMIIKRSETQESIKGPAEYFTGKASIEPIHLEAREPSRVTSALVTFEPGARTNWHRHPLGQLLIITSGTGWTKMEGGERVEVGEGDSVWCPPGQKHWHGATDTTAMSHIAIQEELDSKNVEWLEKVTDEEYLDR
ncbi:MAG: cupin domain-containing protein [Pleurocapsa sp.]